jgi:hypothetical protein
MSENNLASTEKRSRQGEDFTRPYRIRIREKWQDFASIFVKDPRGDYIYDPDKTIDVSKG